MASHAWGKNRRQPCPRSDRDGHSGGMPPFALPPKNFFRNVAVLRPKGTVRWHRLRVPDLTLRSGSSTCTLLATDVILYRNHFDSAMPYQKTVRVPPVITRFVAANDMPLAACHHWSDRCYRSTDDKDLGHTKDERRHLRPRLDRQTGQREPTRSASGIRDEQIHSISSPRVCRRWHAIKLGRVRCRVAAGQRYAGAGFQSGVFHSDALHRDPAWRILSRRRWPYAQNGIARCPRPAQRQRGSFFCAGARLGN
jgi:hypothetical protein